MKPVTIFICTLFALHTFGQSSVRAYLANAAYAADSVSGSENISNATIRSFNKKFSGAANVRWHPTDDGSSVKFRQDNIQYHVFYSKRGSWKATIQYLPLHLVPKWVTGRITSDFNGYSIFFAQHVRTPAGGTYLIKIEKGNSWKHVRIFPEATEVLEEFVRN